MSRRPSAGGKESLVKIVDERFAANIWRYVWQCALATLALLVVLLILDVATNAVVIASLGASSFIAFVMPHSSMSSARRLVGGYLIGTAAGTMCFWASQASAIEGVALVAGREHVIFGAVSVGLAIFMMAISNTEHPPAAGLALAVVLSPWDGRTVLVTLAAIVALSLLKRLLKRWMIDLV